MALTEGELRAFKEIEARLLESSPDLARKLSAPPRVARPVTRSDARTRFRPAAQPRRVALVLTAVAVAVAVATAVTSVGVRVALAVALIVVEAGAVYTVCHYSGWRPRRPRTKDREGAS